MLRISKWFVAIIMYLFVVMALLAFRPALMFDADGHPKPAGLGLKDGYSFMAPSISFPVLALLSYLVSMVTYVVLV